MKPISSIITREHIAGLWRLFVASGGVAILQHGLQQHQYKAAAVGAGIAFAGAVMSWMFHTDNQTSKSITAVTVTNGGAGYPHVPTVTTQFIPGFTILPPGSPVPSSPPEAAYDAAKGAAAVGLDLAKKIAANATLLADAVTQDKAAQPNLSFEAAVKAEVEKHLAAVDWSAELGKVLLEARPLRDIIAERITPPVATAASNPAPSSVTVPSPTSTAPQFPENTVGPSHLNPQ